MKGDRERCIAAGMDAYVAKPIKSAELLAVMNGLFVAKGQSEISSPPSGPRAETIFDPQGALAAIDGDRDILAQMVQWFLEQSPKLMDEVRNAASQNDHQALAAAAHKLKAQVGSFGAQNAYDAAARLEELATEQDPGGWKDALPAVEAAVAKLRSALIEFSSKAKPD